MPASMEWFAPALVVPDLCQTPRDRIAARNGRQVGVAEPGLRFDPGARIGRVDVLQPAIGIGDLGPVVSVDLIGSAAGG